MATWPLTLLILWLCYGWHPLGDRCGEDGEECVCDGGDPGGGPGVHVQPVQLQHQHTQRLERALHQAVDQHRGHQHLVGSHGAPVLWVLMSVESIAQWQCYCVQLTLTPAPPPAGGKLREERLTWESFSRWICCNSCDGEICRAQDRNKMNVRIIVSISLHSFVPLLFIATLTYSHQFEIKHQHLTYL